jgi:hypothetical protein
LLERIDAESVLHLKYAELAVGPVRFDEELCALAEKAGMHPEIVETSVVEIAEHGLFIGVLHGNFVLRGAPQFGFDLMTARTNLAADELSGGRRLREPLAIHPPNSPPVRQQLAAAKYNLDESVVRAPCSGYAVNLQLVPGAVVSAAASVLPFVCDRDEANQGMVVASFMQGPYLRIKPGEYAEVIFPMYPGRVFPGKVVTTIDIASEGQLTATGLFPGIGNPGNARFEVLLDRCSPSHCSCALGW